MVHVLKHKVKGTWENKHRNGWKQKERNKKEEEWKENKLLNESIVYNSDEVGFF